MISVFELRTFCKRINTVMRLQGRCVNSTSVVHQELIIDTYPQRFGLNGLCARKTPKHTGANISNEALNPESWDVTLSLDVDLTS